MTTPVNDRDALILNAASRGALSPSAALFLNASSTSFFVKADNSHNPDVIAIQGTLLLLSGPITFSASGATLSNVTATSCSVAYATVTGQTATITATAANGGNPVSQSITIGVVKDGSSGSGTQGSRGAGHYYASGSSWSDTVASAACPGGPMVNDVVTISDGSTYVMEKIWSGSAWNTQGNVIDGNLLVSRTVSAGALNVGSLSAVTATIGTLRTAATGSRVEISDNVIKVFDGGNLRVKIGNLSL